MDQVEALRHILKGEKLVRPAELFENIASTHHGHVQAVLAAMHRLEFEKLVASPAWPATGSGGGDGRSAYLEPDSKLATTRWWKNTTLPDILGIADATETDLYQALDWLLEHQDIIEKKLAGRHLKDGGLVLYDLTASYFEGKSCPLAAFGHDRDGKKGKLQVNYGLLTDGRGVPVAVSVFEGNTARLPKTLLPQVEMVCERFGITAIVLVGDRGMICQKHIEELRHRGAVDWITALKSGAIRKLVEAGPLQLGLLTSATFLNSPIRIIRESA